MEGKTMFVKGSLLIWNNKYNLVDSIIEGFQGSEIMYNEENLTHKEKPDREHKHNTHPASHQSHNIVELVFFINYRQNRLLRIQIVHNDTQGYDKQGNLYR